MSENFKKRIFTSTILLSLLIIFNFSKFFMVGIFIAILFICIEFSEILSKLVGPGLIKHHRYSSHPEKLNLKYLFLQILAIFYVLIIFGGSSLELHGRSGSPIFFLFILSICFFLCQNLLSGNFKILLSFLIFILSSQQNIFAPNFFKVLAAD